MPSAPNDQLASPHYADRAATKDNLLLVGVASLLCGLFVAVHAIYLTVIIHTPVLQYDEWLVLARYIEFKTGRLSLLSFLWEYYSGHRPALARLLFILDAETVRGTQVLTKTISLSLCVFLTALFAMLLLRQKQIPWGARLFGVGLLILVLLPNQEIYNFSIGWNNAILTNVWFSVLALYLLTKSIEKTVKGNQAFALLVCALLSGVLSTFSLTNGLLIWPIMFLVCARFRAWPWAIIVAIVGTVIITTYLWNFQTTGLLLDALKHPDELLYFFVTFLGNPLGLTFLPLGLRASTLFGAFGILLVVYHFFRQNWRIDHDSPTVCFLLSVCLFFIGTAGLATIARFKVGAELGVQPVQFALQMRYYSFVSPLWAATLLLGFILHKQNIERVRGNVWTILDAGALVVSIFICGSAYFKGPSSDLLMLMHDDRERATTAIVAGAPDQNALKSLYPYPDMDIFSSVPYLASNRLSVFHSNVDYFLYQKAHNALHKPLSDGMLLDGEWCAGAIDDINKVADVGRSSSTWNQISGWLLDREMERTADGVLFTDEEGRLVGIGRMLFARPDVEQSFEFEAYAADRSLYWLRGAKQLAGR